jgi:hypothetical protein
MGEIVTHGEGNTGVVVSIYGFTVVTNFKAVLCVATYPLEESIAPTDLYVLDPAKPQSFNVVHSCIPARVLPTDSLEMKRVQQALMAKGAAWVSERHADSEALQSYDKEMEAHRVCGKRKRSEPRKNPPETAPPAAARRCAHRACTATRLGRCQRCAVHCNATPCGTRTHNPKPSPPTKQHSPRHERETPKRETPKREPPVTPKPTLLNPEAHTPGPDPAIVRYAANKKALGELTQHELVAFVLAAQANTKG